MAPKKSKASLQKAGTMAATAAAGQEFLKQAWGEDKLNRVNELLEARDKSDTDADEPAPATSSSSASSTTAPTDSASPKAKGKPKLSKARTMKSTAKEGKALIGNQTLGGTRADTQRRQAAVKATKALREVTQSTSGRKPGLKRLGTMANTAREGKSYIKRTAGKAAKNTTGRKRTGGRAKKATK